MRLIAGALCCALLCSFTQGALAEEEVPKAASTVGKPLSAKPATPSHIEVTADKSLEWYEDTRLYVARGNAKAIRGDMTVVADLLTAHERDLPAKPDGTDANKAGGSGAKPAVASNPPVAPNSPSVPKPPPAVASAGKTKPQGSDNGTGDIDKMTADGHVHVTTSRSNIYGDHAVYDLNQHVAVMTGKDDLKYETASETVTAKDSLEYWEDKKIGVARGHAIGIKGDRRVDGDVLTAQFRDMPNGQSELHTLTADGTVSVYTGQDVSRGDHAVYDISRNIAILTGNVRITKADGTQLAGDVGEVDFATNQSRLLNEGSGRVRALLTSKTAPAKASKADATTAAATGTP